MIPHLSLSVGIRTRLLCVATLVYFVGHMARRINVDTVIELVSDDVSLDAIRRLTTDTRQPDPPAPDALARRDADRRFRDGATCSSSMKMASPTGRRITIRPHSPAGSTGRLYLSRHADRPDNSRRSKAPTPRSAMPPRWGRSVPARPISRFAVRQSSKLRCGPCHLASTILTPRSARSTGSGRLSAK